MWGNGTYTDEETRIIKNGNSLLHEDAFRGNEMNNDTFRGNDEARSTHLICPGFARHEMNDDTFRGNENIEDGQYRVRFIINGQI
ncbi:hypothetical protein NL676_020835 [Syzygium grande]|nr:hypothetical protein NL676_020835 [Syzygium grande]